MFQINKKSAFTLVELLVAMLISSILISITVSTYTLFRKSIAEDQNKAAITQNARVAFDRLSRELRQTPDIVSKLPVNLLDTVTAQPGEIEFEDGHASPGDTNYLSYRRYYLIGTNLKLDTIEYYFSAEPTIRVKYDSVRSGGVLPIKRVLSTQDVAETVQSIAFYGTHPIIFYLTSSDGKQSLTLRTSLYERN